MRHDQDGIRCRHAVSVLRQSQALQGGICAFVLPAWIMHVEAAAVEASEGKGSLRTTGADPLKTGTVQPCTSKRAAVWQAQASQAERCPLHSVKAEVTSNGWPAAGHRIPKLSASVLHRAAGRSDEGERQHRTLSHMLQIPLNTILIRGLLHQLQVQSGHQCGLWSRSLTTPIMHRAAGRCDEGECQHSPHLCIEPISLFCEPCQAQASAFLTSGAPSSLS